MKILAVCAHGLGSSFLMEMNIKKVLAKLGIEAEVGHADFSVTSGNDADVFVMGADIAASASLPPEKTCRTGSLQLPRAEKEKRLNSETPTNQTDKRCLVF